VKLLPIRRLRGYRNDETTVISEVTFLWAAVSLWSVASTVPYLAAVPGWCVAAAAAGSAGSAYSFTFWLEPDGADVWAAAFAVTVRTTRAPGGCQ